MTPRRSRGSGLALDEAPGEEAVDAVGHRPARHEGFGDELAGGELVGRTGSAQGREDVELPAVEPVLGECCPAGEVETAREPRDPAEDFERSDVEFRTLTAPG